MVQSVLGSLTLGYRPLWNGARRMAGVQLFVAGDDNVQVDALHLLRTIEELWDASSPPLLLAPRTPQILAEWLEHAPPGSPSIEVSDAWLVDPDLLTRARAAQRRGLKLVWHGPLARLPEPEVAALFHTSVLTLEVQDAVAALRAGKAQAARGAGASASPIIAGQIYEGVDSRALMRHCLDGAGALALAGWPADDVLYSLRHQSLAPAHEVVLKLLKAIDDEQSIDAQEQVLGEDPLLAYRFMTYTNSAALGLRTGVDSVRRGLVMMGYGSIQRWLGDQLPGASTEPDLRPVRESAVLRARLAEQLIEAGVGKELRAEMYLCALFSRLDALMGEPLGAILRRLPLSERVYEAAVLHTGPYAPSLDMAVALEGEDAALVRRLCEEHGHEREQVNRSLLHVLRAWEVPRGPHGA
ncbi:HDOD domain-containing protein [Comamonas sp. NLF-1-9]|uniref:HDOD domain-containing protein n=1 Tax=Comamonas sp. NLF-1-9 TaxID=2853163 RepID=UPI001C452B4C|nr:HDOD domain-containing protein [Comamonas sp. NLF-1-9]QXL84249.1 HDOD domain-containing protein [Comamonas sp. NLF-1-9]